MCLTIKSLLEILTGFFYFVTIYNKIYKMKFLLTERQLKLLKFFLVKKEQLIESKIGKGVELKDAEVLGSKKKEDNKEEAPKKREPIIDKSIIKIDSVSQLEKVLQAIAHYNKGLKVPTKLKSKFEKEVKFTTDIVSDMKTKLERLIKTTSAVNHDLNEKKDVFKTTNNKTDSTGKLKSTTLKAELRKALKLKSIQLPLSEVQIERQVIKDFLEKVTQDYSSNFVIQRAEGGKNNLVYGK